MGIARRLCGRHFGGRNTKAKLAINASSDIPRRNARDGRDGICENRRNRGT